MCELLNRIWSRPRGEWRRVLRKELPSLAGEIVEELLQGTPGLPAGAEDMDDELLRQAVEAALLVALGYQAPARRNTAPAGAGADLADAEDAEDAEITQGPVDEPPFDNDVRHDHDENPEPGPGPDGPRGHCHEPPLTVVPDRARQELFNALIGDEELTEAGLASLAARARWPQPPALRVVVPATPGEAQQLAGVLDDALAGLAGGQPCLLVPDPEGDRRAALELALRGRFAAVGHPVPPRDAPSSLRWALRLLALAPARAAGAEVRPLFVDDHLSTLLLLQDEPLAHALAARWLRPLADLTPRQSERLEVTLLAWLEGGGAPEAAKALSVHPQTVRYRMRQLEKLFGPGLRDPRTRFELEMALRSRRLMAQVRRQHSRTARRVRPVTTEFRPVGAGRLARVNGL
ncbi:helix-turn-helix domain-containing protein [Streptomyces sp. NPDC089919]|uniref:PucR family transcriptional regulator n=1 Tax=Streptomyces sp. NPDC089919 TaxID=3155188 RepID=UPI0034160ED2